MKKNHSAWNWIYLLLPCLILLTYPLTSCDDTTPAGSNIEEPSGSLTATSGCKAFVNELTPSHSSPNQDCIAYYYDRAGTLQLTHINAGFNCCPGEITADIDIDNHVITITEHESMQQCRCLCLYDVEYQIEDLPQGVYEIHVIGLYLEEGDEPLSFTVNLALDPEGYFCVERTHYPWPQQPVVEPYGVLTDLYGCKALTSPATIPSTEGAGDCIDYNYLPSNILLLQHRNAGFNCCPNISVDFDIGESTITITESDLGLCDCSCLYDISYSILHLPPGEYTISVIEPLVGPQEEQLEFTVDLTTAPTGAYCVDRSGYPWP